MNERDRNREYIEKESLRRPGSYPDAWVRRYGMEGTLDIHDAQDAHSALGRINLSRRPWAGREDLKGAYRVALDALQVLNQMLYVDVIFPDDDAERAPSGADS